VKLKPLLKTKALEFCTAEVGKSLEIPYFEDGVSAGFLSPATDYMDDKLDLNDLLVEHPQLTMFV
jgi:DNA polymerase V